MKHAAEPHHSGRFPGGVPGGVESPARTLLRGLVGPVDPRTPEELEQDLADEIAFHLAAIEAEERTAGLDADAARIEARRRFGDPDRVRAECRRIALEEQSMIQRLNAVLIVVLLAGVVAIGVHGFLSQRATSRTLGELAQAVERLGSMQSAEVVPTAAPLDPDAVRNIDAATITALDDETLKHWLGLVANARLDIKLDREARDELTSVFRALIKESQSRARRDRQHDDSSNPTVDPSEAAPVVGFIYLDGNGWKNPGAHPLPPGEGFMLRRLALGAAGLNRRSDELAVDVDRFDPSTDDGATRLWSGRWWSEESGDPEGFPALRTGDIVKLRQLPRTSVQLFSSTGPTHIGDDLHRDVSYPSTAPQTLAQILEASRLLTLPEPFAGVEGTVASVVIDATVNGTSMKTQHSWQLDGETPPEVKVPRGATITLAFDLPEEPPEVPKSLLLPSGPQPAEGHDGARIALSILDRALDEGKLSDSAQHRMLAEREQLRRRLNYPVEERPFPPSLPPRRVSAPAGE